MIEIAKPKFCLGTLVSTPGALSALTEAGQSPMEFVARHVRGDWAIATSMIGRQMNTPCEMASESFRFIARRRARRFGSSPRLIEVRRVCCCRRNIERRIVPFQTAIAVRSYSAFNRSVVSLPERLSIKTHVSPIWVSASFRAAADPSNTPRPANVQLNLDEKARWRVDGMKVVTAE
jgi:hypothetical protein